MATDTDVIRALYAETSLGGPDEAVGFVLWRVMHRYQRAVDRSLQPHGLTHLQFTTLAIVGWMCRSNAPATQVELARQADIHPMQVSLMLKALEAKRMVVRARSSTDTRARSVDITESGLESVATGVSSRDSASTRHIRRSWRAGRNAPSRIARCGGTRGAIAAIPLPTLAGCHTRHIGPRRNNRDRMLQACFC